MERGADAGFSCMVCKVVRRSIELSWGFFHKLEFCVFYFR